MAKISVELEAFYGYSCGFQSHGSNETVEIEVSDNELEALKKFGKKEITTEDIVAAIEGGDTTLESLHEQLSEKFYYMVEEYWLYEADNDCLEENLEESLEKDIEKGMYEPMLFDDFVEEWKSGNLDEEYIKYNCFDNLDNIDFDDKDELWCRYEHYVSGRYYDWVKEHDHAFIAERVGLDLDACRDDEVNYAVSLPED